MALRRRILTKALMPAVGIRHSQIKFLSKFGRPLCKQNLRIIFGAKDPLSPKQSQWLETIRRRVALT
jgi:hypothetical protein